MTFSSAPKLNKHASFFPSYSFKEYTIHTRTLLTTSIFTSLLVKPSFSIKIFEAFFVVVLSPCYSFTSQDRLNDAPLTTSSTGKIMSDLYYCPLWVSRSCSSSYSFKDPDKHPYVPTASGRSRSILDTGA